MALTNRIVRRVDLPHEPGQWVEIRMPSLGILDRAREVRSRRAIEMVAGIDLSQIKGASGERPARSGAEFDWLTLLAGCITAWSYADPVSAENVGELDEVTVSVLVEALLVAPSEADRKKVSGSSTAPSKVTASRPRNG